MAAGFRNDNGKYSSGSKSGPLDRCTICNHNHLNKDCFKQHPELKKKKKKGRAAKAVHEEDVASSDDENEGPRLGTIASAAAKFNNHLLYDTGASHHFVKCREDFVSLRRLTKPFQFDQAVGNSALTHARISRLKIGNLNLDLKDSLHSPNSTCNIVSAVKLNEQYGIVASNRNTTLVQATKVKKYQLLK